MSVFICLTKLRDFDLEIELERLQTIDRLIFQFPFIGTKFLQNEMLDRYGLGGSQTLLIK